jgi:ribosomal protein S27E
MSDTPVECPSCKAPLAQSLFNQAHLVPCTGCGRGLRLDVYPAFFRPIALGRSAETLVMENEAGCFFHPLKKAVVPCEACGRFLCALCDCELHGQHFCPGCLRAGQKRGKSKRLEQERTLYDSIALSLAVYPLLLFYLTLVTAPVTLWVAIRFWDAPRSLVHRTRARLVLAILIAGAEILGWMVVIYLLATHWKRHA